MTLMYRVNRESGPFMTSGLVSKSDVGLEYDKQSEYGKWAVRVTPEERPNPRPDQVLAQAIAEAQSFLPPNRIRMVKAIRDFCPKDAAGYSLLGLKECRDIVRAFYPDTPIPAPDYLPGTYPCCLDCGDNCHMKGTGHGSPCDSPYCNGAK